MSGNRKKSKPIDLKCYKPKNFKYITMNKIIKKNKNHRNWKHIYYYKPNKSKHFTYLFNMLNNTDITYKHFEYNDSKYEICKSEIDGNELYINCEQFINKKKHNSSLKSETILDYINSSDGHILVYESIDKINILPNDFYFDFNQDKENFLKRSMNQFIEKIFMDDLVGSNTYLDKKALYSRHDPYLLSKSNDNNYINSEINKEFENNIDDILITKTSKDYKYKNLLNCDYESKFDNVKINITEDIDSLSSIEENNKNIICTINTYLIKKAVQTGGNNSNKKTKKTKTIGLKKNKSFKSLTPKIKSNLDDRIIKINKYINKYFKNTKKILLDNVVTIQELINQYVSYLNTNKYKINILQYLIEIVDINAKILIYLNQIKVNRIEDNTILKSFKNIVIENQNRIHSLLNSILFEISISEKYLENTKHNELLSKCKYEHVENHRMLNRILIRLNNKLYSLDKTIYVGGGNNKNTVIKPLHDHYKSIFTNIDSILEKYSRYIKRYIKKDLGHLSIGNQLINNDNKNEFDRNIVKKIIDNIVKKLELIVNSIDETKLDDSFEKIKILYIKKDEEDKFDSKYLFINNKKNIKKFITRLSNINTEDLLDDKKIKIIFKYDKIFDELIIQATEEKNYNLYQYINTIIYYLQSNILNTDSFTKTEFIYNKINDTPPNKLFEEILGSKRSNDYHNILNKMKNMYSLMTVLKITLYPKLCNNYYYYRNKINSTKLNIIGDLCINDYKLIDYSIINNYSKFDSTHKNIYDLNWFIDDKKDKINEYKLFVEKINNDDENNSNPYKYKTREQISMLINSYFIMKFSDKIEHEIHSKVQSDEFTKILKEFEFKENISLDIKKIIYKILLIPEKDLIIILNELPSFRNIFENLGMDIFEISNFNKDGWDYDSEYQDKDIILNSLKKDNYEVVISEIFTDITSDKYKIILNHLKVDIDKLKKEDILKPDAYIIKDIIKILDDSYKKLLDNKDKKILESADLEKFITEINDLLFIFNEPKKYLLYYKIRQQFKNLDKSYNKNLNKSYNTIPKNDDEESLFNLYLTEKDRLSKHTKEMFDHTINISKDRNSKNYTFIQRKITDRTIYDSKINLENKERDLQIKKNKLQQRIKEISNLSKDIDTKKIESDLTKIKDLEAVLNNIKKEKNKLQQRIKENKNNIQKETKEFKNKKESTDYIYNKNLFNKIHNNVIDYISDNNNLKYDYNNEYIFDHLQILNLTSKRKIYDKLFILQMIKDNPVNIYRLYKKSFKIIVYYIFNLIHIEYNKLVHKLESADFINLYLGDGSNYQNTQFYKSMLEYSKFINSKSIKNKISKTLFTENESYTKFERETTHIVDYLIQSIREKELSQLFNKLKNKNISNLDVSLSF